MKDNKVLAIIGRDSATTRPVYQWDYGMRLELSGVTLPDAYEVHFANNGGTVSTTEIGDSTGVDIPDIYLTTGADVVAWLYLHTGEADGETVKYIHIPVIKRAQPTHETPTPVQQSEITEAIAALNAAVEKSETNVSHYPKIEDGYWYTWNAETSTWTQGIAAQGPQGETGPQGPQGIQGIQGPQGEQGEKGETGAQGPAGADGKDGKDGVDGKDGADGAAATITVGTTTTGEAGTDASVTNSGTTSAAVLDFTIPRGDKGDKGDTGEVSEAELTSKLMDKADIVTASASGSIASFADGANNLPVKDLTITITPVQAGSGDPSPSNPRPISGWTGANVVRCGENIFDKNAYTVGPVTFTGASSSLTRSGIKFTLPQGTYKAKCFGSNVVSYISIYQNNSEQEYINGYYLSTTASEGWKTVTMSISDGDELFLVAASGVTLNLDCNLKIVHSDTIGDYEPYNGTAYPISWQSEAGTVYGGTLDVTTGILKAVPYYASYNGETLTGRWISDRDVYAEGTTPTLGAQVVDIDGTPTEYQLTPMEVRTLLGQNNIWSDTGDSAVTYRADTKKYIDTRIAALQALILNS